MSALPQSVCRPARLGFLGVGWIGRNRMQAVAGSGAAEVVALLDPCEQACAAALSSVPYARRVRALEDLLDSGIDGLVIATPSAAHAEQAIAALQHGVAVFCQKPLARTAAEAARVVDAARAADRLLGVDFSYRHIAGAAQMRHLLRSGALGELRAIDLVFHNAYGPDKPWFRDASLSGGGCVMDLGIHLLDLALWMGDASRIEVSDAHLLSGSSRLLPPVDAVEDYACVQGRMGAASLRLACSWNLPAGRDAVIEASFYASGGAVSLRNVDGSFYDFVAERFDGTRRTLLAVPPEPRSGRECDRWAWGGRALVQWARRLAEQPGFDPECSSLVDVSRAVDAIYGR